MMRGRAPIIASGSAAPEFPSFDRLGLAAARPQALAPLPAFTDDRLDPARSGRAARRPSGPGARCQWRL
ncbi:MULTISPECIES: hypothetical protein [unclassified Streptomyces]|uniref:hypothetical protein n=1 Tax=unclassified Streptomyces TaxID=2593676 RepID=UPI00331EA6DD